MLTIVISNQYSLQMHVWLKSLHWRFICNIITVSNYFWLAYPLRDAYKYTCACIHNSKIYVFYKTNMICKYRIYGIQQPFYLSIYYLPVEIRKDNRRHIKIMSLLYPRRSYLLHSPHVNIAWEWLERILFLYTKATLET